MSLNDILLGTAIALAVASAFLAFYLIPKAEKNK